MAISWFILTLFVFTLQPGVAGIEQDEILEPEAPALAPSLWATPLELDFGPVGVGETSSPQVVTITNMGDAKLANFVDGGVLAPFNIVENCSVGVNPGQSCQYFVSFSPTSPGEFSGSHTTLSNAGPFTINMRGEAVGTALTVTPLSLDFGSIALNETSPQQIVTIRNSGLAALADFVDQTLLDPFNRSSNCDQPLGSGETCQYFFSFSPLAAGDFGAGSTTSTNAGQFTIQMKGEGRSTPAGLGQFATPLSIDFGPVGTGVESTTQIVTITNQDPDTTITGFTGGDVEAPFQLENQDCAAGLPPGESCQYEYIFNPTSDETSSARIIISSSLGSFSVDLAGTGVGASVSASPLVLDFGPLTVGLTSDPQIITIKNTGLAVLQDFIGGGVPAPFSGSQNCTNGVPPGGSCNYTFYFQPEAAGLFTATSQTSTNGGSINIQLRGGALPPHIAKSFTPQVIPPGGISTLQIAIHNPNPSTTLFEVNFTDSFPAGMVIASPLTFSTTSECGTPKFIPVARQGSFSLSEATILGGNTCLVNIDVSAPLIGSYTNTTGQVSSRAGSGNTASATLLVAYRTYLPFTSR